MTVIVWDGKTLAADRRVSHGSTIGCPTVKLHRVDDGIIGLSGGTSDVAEFLNWYRKGADFEKFPAHLRTDNNSFLALLVRKGGVYMFSSSPFPSLCAGRYVAIGCGMEAALAALECGKDALGAVVIASRVNSGCGDGADIMLPE